MFTFGSFFDKDYKVREFSISLSIEEKAYVYDVINKITKLITNIIDDDFEIKLDDSDKYRVVMYVNYWVTCKSINLLKAEIPCEYRDNILEKIALRVFTIAKQGLLDKVSSFKLEKDITKNVEKLYIELIEKLFDEELITECAKSLALYQVTTLIESRIILKNNIDYVKEMESVLKKCEKNPNTIDWFDFFGSLITLAIFTLIFFFLGYLLSSFCIFILNYFNLLPNSISINPIISSIVAGILIFIALKISVENDLKVQLGKLEKVKKEMQELTNPDRMLERLGVYVISIDIGQKLVSLADPDSDGLLLPKIAALRQRLTDSLGFIVPNVRCCDSSKLDDYEYCIYIRNNPVARGFVYPDKFMVFAEQFNSLNSVLPDNVIISEDPVYKKKVYWLDNEIVNNADNILAFDPVDVIITHIDYIVILYVDYIFSEIETKKYVNQVEKDLSVSFSSLLEKITYYDIRDVFVNLIKEKVSIKDVYFILSRLQSYSRYYVQPDILSELIRKDLSRQICFSFFCREESLLIDSSKEINSIEKAFISLFENNKIYAIDLSEELTNNLLEKIEFQKDCNKTRLLIDKDVELSLKDKVIEKMLDASKQINSQPILICDDKLRLALYRLMSKYIPNIVVLANNEVVDDVDLIVLSTIQ